MNPNNPDIKEYLEKLPPIVQKSIGSSEWKQKIIDIGNKYSLQEGQIESLEIEALLVAIGVESDQEMVENIKRELDVSDILAEQLTEDVNQRIYKWIYRQWSPVETKIEENTEGSSATTSESNSIHPLDIPPLNLPGEVIAEEENEFVAKPTLIQDQVKDFFAPKMAEEPVVAAAPSSFVPTIETPIEEPMPQKTQSFISQRLTQPTVPQKYTADQYREPIE